MLQSVMPVPSRVPVPDVLPAVMPAVPAVPEFLPAAPPVPVLPAGVPADLPAEGREALAAALAGPLPGAQRRPPGRTILPDDSPLAWDDAEMARFCGFLRSMSDRRDPRGRRLPLDYLAAVAVAAGAAGDDSPEGAAAWAASAPDRILHRLGAPRDAAGRPRRPDAATFSRVLGDPRHAQQVDDVLCAWTAARARGLRPGMRRHLRIDGKALRGAARGGHAPMLLSGLWDDGTTAAQLPVSTRKENEIPVFRDLLDKIPPGDLEGAVISADQMHTQRKHAQKIEAAGAFFLFTIGGNQEKLFDAADELPWRAFAGEAWTVDRGHGRIDVRTIKTLPPTPRILKKWKQVRQVFLAERYTYGTSGELLGAVAVLGITSLPPEEAGAADLLAYLRGHWSIEVHHYVRDVAFGEDRHRAAAAWQAFAAIRNAVTGAFRLLRVPGIAAQLRASRHDPYRLPLQILGLATLPRYPTDTTPRPR